MSAEGHHSLKIEINSSLIFDLRSVSENKQPACGDKHMDGGATGGDGRRHRAPRSTCCAPTGQSIT